MAVEVMKEAKVISCDFAHTGSGRYVPKEGGEGCIIEDGWRVLEEAREGSHTASTASLVLRRVEEFRKKNEDRPQEERRQNETKGTQAVEWSDEGVQTEDVCCITSDDLLCFNEEQVYDTNSQTLQEGAKDCVDRGGDVPLASSTAQAGSPPLAARLVKLLVALDFSVLSLYNRAYRTWRRYLRCFKLKRKVFLKFRVACKHQRQTRARVREMFRSWLRIAKSSRKSTESRIFKSPAMDAVEVASLIEKRRGKGKGSSAECPQSDRDRTKVNTCDRVFLRKQEERLREISSRRATKAERARQRLELEAAQSTERATEAAALMEEERLIALAAKSEEEDRKRNERAAVNLRHALTKEQNILADIHRQRGMTVRAWRLWLQHVLHRRARTQSADDHREQKLSEATIRLWHKHVVAMQRGPQEYRMKVLFRAYADTVARHRRRRVSLVFHALCHALGLRKEYMETAVSFNHRRIMKSCFSQWVDLRLMSLLERQVVAIKQAAHEAFREWRETTATAKRARAEAARQSALLARAASLLDAVREKKETKTCLLPPCPNVPITPPLSARRSTQS